MDDKLKSDNDDVLKKQNDEREVHLHPEILRRQGDQKLHSSQRSARNNNNENKQIKK